MTASGDEEVVRFCRSRRAGRRCTRRLDHPGLHRHRSIMWTDAAADPLRCAGSGAAAVPAAPLPDGYPDGRALCETCLRLVPLDADRRLVEHDTTDADESALEVRQRREWLNGHGW